MPPTFSNGCDRVEGPSRPLHRNGETTRSTAKGRGGSRTAITGISSLRELVKATEILALLPGAGTPYTQTGVAELRRLYIRKLGCHLYYTFDADDVIIRALWAARRERGPTF